MNRALRQTVDFLESIGIATRRSNSPRLPSGSRAFVDGVWVDRGVLVFHRTARASDVYHEAGHLAVTPSFLRPHITPGMNHEDPTLEFTQATEAYLSAHPNGMLTWPEDPGCRAILQMGECEAIAWSYAAMLASGAHLPSLWRQDDKNFNGVAPCVRTLLGAGAHAGIHGLQASGMTTTWMFPKMRHWLQSEKIEEVQHS